MNPEQGFLRALQEHPEDVSGLLIFADFLEERDHPEDVRRGELLRLVVSLTRTVHCPNRRRQEARLQELLTAGVRPTWPTLTNSVGLEMALIPPGCFRFGSPQDEGGRDTDEGPAREVAITRPFSLGIYPVTQQQYVAVMGTNPSMFGSQPERPEHPVESVSWHQAVEFCTKLSLLPQEKESGRTYRLPTEAEWEYACRAGTTTAFHFGASASSAQANFKGDYPYGEGLRAPTVGMTSPVGLYLPNGFGLYDMHGNVWEWCADAYAEDFYQWCQANDPHNASHNALGREERCRRGGCWRTEARYCRAARRGVLSPNDRDSVIGFRVALTTAGLG